MTQYWDDIWHDLVAWYIMFCHVMERIEKGRLGGRTFSKEKWTENELFMTVDHFGSGGRRSDSRLGRRGKKLAESRKVGKWESREIVISEISRFFMDFLI